MGRSAFTRIFLWFAGLVMLASSHTHAHAQVAVNSGCHMNAPAGTSYEQAMKQPERWACGDSDWSIRSDVTFLRFKANGALVPEALVTRLTRFESMRLTVIGEDGRQASRTVLPDEMTFSTHSWEMSTPLPKLATAVQTPIQTIVVEVVRPRHLGMVADARIGYAPGNDPGSFRTELIIAVLCGLLVAPLIFNMIFYRVLRERFVLWHAAAVFFMLGHTFVSSGLINRFFAPTMMEISVLSVITWGGGIIAASLFIIDLVEPGKIDPLHRRLVRGLCVWVLGWSAFYFVADGSLRPLANPLYMASFLPLLAVFIWIMAVAKIRGSRAINFQIAAWTPMMITGAVRVLTSLGFSEAPMGLMVEQHASIALEVLITTFGVTDRFMIIKRQRDRAMSNARIMEDLADRDALTSLLNRRAVEPRFETLREEGFDTVAVIDIDRFKDINDRFGHQTGDNVLKACAAALQTDKGRNSIAIRLGGEEFMLLLRGKDARNRAEAFRQAITTRIASDVEGLDRPITASMGIIEIPRHGFDAVTFAELYARADKLLYEAKAAGRNRTMSEKLQHFGKGPGKNKAAA